MHSHHSSLLQVPNVNTCKLLKYLQPSHLYCWNVCSPLIYTIEMSKTLLDGNGHTCMHFAAKRGEVEVLEELHAAGANFSTPSRWWNV